MVQWILNGESNWVSFLDRFKIASYLLLLSPLDVTWPATLLKYPGKLRYGWQMILTI